MNIRNTRLGFAALLWVAVPFVPPAAAYSHHSGPTVNVYSDRAIDSCADIRVQYDERDAARAEESFEIPAGSAPLTVRLPENSGIHVNGGSRSGFDVTVCKFARRAESLSGIRVTPAGSGVAFRSAADGNWMVYLIVRAPRDAALDLEAKNGPIGLRGFSGRIRVKTTNGPISLDDCSGPLDATAVNGPISLDGCSGTGDARAVNGPIDFSGSRGTYRLDTKNGPISVALEGKRWEGGSLDAHAVNGPLSLKISEDYSSAVRVEMLGHGPVDCPSSVCHAARKAWDDDSRTIDFGESGSEPVVRLSTQNGPVSVAPAR
jgi:hypothetical protein